MTIKNTNPQLIDKLLLHLNKEIIANESARKKILNAHDIESPIDKIVVKLINWNFSEISESELKTALENFGPEELEILSELKNTLDKYDMSEDFEFYAPDKEIPEVLKTVLDISREDAIKYILSSFVSIKETIKDINIRLQRIKNELAEKGIEHQVIYAFKDSLIDILKSLERKRKLETDEYNNLYENNKKLFKIFTLVKESLERVLTQEEKDTIYNYLINSQIENKMDIYIEVVSIGLKQARIKAQQPDSYSRDRIHDVVEENIQKQKTEVASKNAKRQESEWKNLFEETIKKINENTKLTSIQKRILEKIIRSSIKIESSELNLYEELLDDHKNKKISLNSRQEVYSGLRSFEEIEIGTISIDLALNLMENLENHEEDILEIIDFIVDRYNQCFLSEEEINDVKQLIEKIEENYPNLSYILYTDEKKIELEEKFKEYNGNIQKFINYANYNNIQLDEGYDSFIENTFKKIIKNTLEELKNAKEKGKILKLKNQLEDWEEKYSKYSNDMESAIQQYTIEDIENMDLASQNVIIFLRDEEGTAVYKSGLLNNGLNKNGKFLAKSVQKARDIINQVVFGDNIEFNPGHSKFVAYINENNEGRKDSGTSKDRTGNHVIIADHYLIRLSRGEEARISAIELNKIPEANKKKIGISPEKTIFLIVGVREINHDQKSKGYSKMAEEALQYKERIAHIVSKFENPETSKETLLSYIADSYGLLDQILNGGISKKQKKGGKK